MDRFDLKNTINDYINHLSDKEYLKSILTSVDALTLIEVFTELLKELDDQVVVDVCLFIRDIIIVAPDEGCKQELLNTIYESSVISELEKLLFDDSFRKRSEAVYTLGKITSQKSVGVLKECFLKFRELDPLLIGRLIFEILWLSKTDLEWLVNETFKAKLYLTRWAALESFDTMSFSPDEKDWNIKYKLFSGLGEDENEFVSQEAKYLKEEMEFEKSLSFVESNVEKRKMRKELEKKKPELTFSVLHIKFSNFLFQENMKDYCVKDMENFVKQVVCNS